MGKVNSTIHSTRTAGEGRQRSAAQRPRECVASDRLGFRLWSMASTGMVGSSHTHRRRYNTPPFTSGKMDIETKRKKKIGDRQRGSCYFLCSPPPPHRRCDMQFTSSPTTIPYHLLTFFFIFFLLMFPLRSFVGYGFGGWTAFRWSAVYLYCACMYYGPVLSF